MGRADMDAYDGLTRSDRTSTVGHHHRAHPELTQSLLGELVQYSGELSLPSIELESLDGHPVILSTRQAHEADHAAAAIRIEHLAQSLWVEPLRLDEHPYASHAVPSGCCA